MRELSGKAPCMEVGVAKRIGLEIELCRTLPCTFLTEEEATAIREVEQGG